MFLGNEREAKELGESIESFLSRMQINYIWLQKRAINVHLFMWMCQRVNEIYCDDSVIYAGILDLVFVRIQWAHIYRQFVLFVFSNRVQQYQWFRFSAWFRARIQSVRFLNIYRQMSVSSWRILLPFVLGLGEWNAHAQSRFVKRTQIMVSESVFMLVTEIDRNRTNGISFVCIRYCHNHTSGEVSSWQYLYIQIQHQSEYL